MPEVPDVRFRSYEARDSAAVKNPYARREVSNVLTMIAIQAATLFELTESGRLLHGNSPDRSLAPRMWMGGSAAGNIVRIRVDVREEPARAIEALVAREPPMSEAHGMPVHMDEYADLRS